MLICQENPEAIQKWYAESNNVVVVSVDDEGMLLDLASCAKDRGIGTYVFTEPDLGDEATAVAFEPGELAGKLCANLPLAGREVVH